MPSGRIATPVFPPSPFRSFWMGGFEGADHLNARSEPLDMVAASGHLARLETDFAGAAALGIRSVRESIGWRLAEPAPGRFDFRRMRRMADAARAAGVQIVWTFMHYGVPSDLSLFDDRLIDRFVAFAGTAAAELASCHDGPEPLVVNPINEIGFVAWAASETAILGGPRPAAMTGHESTLASGYAVKRRLVRAALAAIDAIRRAEPSARAVHIEPVVHVVPPAGRPELQPVADLVSSYQWQVWDLMEGRLEPGLGGHPGALDVIGVNHYHSSQWEVETEERLLWHLDDPRRMPFAAQLERTWRRYRHRMIVAETSHFGAGRAEWLDEVAAEVLTARRSGLPVDGLCLYPLVDRPDWDDAGHWHRSGVWDRGATLQEAILHRPYADAIARWQRLLPGPADA